MVRLRSLGLASKGRLETGTATREPCVVVGIPVRNEAERVGSCLLALAAQTRLPYAVVLLLNNCTDQTEAVARSLAPQLPYLLEIRCRHLPLATAHAGEARRLAMQYAADRGGPHSVLMTTDGDGVVAHHWVERNLSAIAAGADLVCGKAAIDPVEAAVIPANLHADDALECELVELLDRIVERLDPDPADPWPRHTEASGASLAVRAAAFGRVGGIPAVAVGEDRAFVAALRRMDARIRHDPTILVTVSGRIEGRAKGGMADTIRRRIRQQDEFTDASIEPAIDAYRRVDFRKRLRHAWQRMPDETLSADLGIPFLTLERMLEEQFFGSAWAIVEAQSPFLIRRRVRFSELRRQIGYSRKLLEQVSPAEAAAHEA